MGLLTSFLGGALGPGLQQAAANMNRRDELEAARLQREEERRLDREQQERLLQERLGAGLGGAGRAGTGSGRAAAIGKSELELGVAQAQRLMADEGMSGPEIEQAVEAARTGKNPYTRTAGPSPDEIMDPRDAKARPPTAEPDEDKFRAIMKAVGRAAIRGGADGTGAADDQAKADLLYQQGDLTRDVANGKRSRDTVAGAVAAGKGEKQYDVDGGMLLDTRGGKATVTPVGQSEIRKNDGMANDHNAKASKTGVERKALVDNGGMTPAERTGLLNSYVASASEASRKVNAAEGAVQKAEAALSKALTPDAKKQAQGAVDEARDALKAAREDYAAKDKQRNDFQAERREKVPGAKPAEAKGLKRAPDAVLAQARAAMAKKAPRDAIVDRLRKAGYSDEGL